MFRKTLSLKTTTCGAVLMGIAMQAAHYAVQADSTPGAASASGTAGQKSLPAVGEWDGVTPSAVLDRPYEDQIQSKVLFGIVSFYNMPWRSYMDTWPAGQWQYMGGANWNIDSKYAVPMAQLLSEVGIRTVRVELGWGNIGWNDDYDEGRKAQIKAEFAAFKKYGIRPMILLNAHHGVPCPMRDVHVKLLQDAKKGDHVLHLEAGTQVHEGYVGVSHPDYIAAYPLITKVDADGTAHLSAGLGRDLTAGDQALQELKYRPFQGIALKDATPEENARVAAEAQATADGFVKYAAATARLAREALGTAGQPDAGFDLEVWNEQTFGSNFLNINNYYDPHLNYTQPFTYQKTRAYTPGMRPDAQLSFSQADAYAVLPMTIDYINAHRDEYPGVKVVSGFANQWPWDSGTSLWDGQAGFSRHYYTGGWQDFFPNDPNNPNTSRITSVNALGGLDGTFDHKDWHTILPGTAFVPTLRVGQPEFLHSGFKTESLSRDVLPDSRYVYMSGHGRYTHNGDYHTAELWETEVNYARNGLFDQLFKDGVDPKDPRALALDEYFAGKFALRQYLFHNAKGLKRIYLFALSASPYNFGMFPQRFYDALDKSNGQITPAIRAGMPPEFKGLGWFTHQMDTAQPITTTRALHVDKLVEYKPRLAYAGEGTPIHPNKWNRDFFAFLPYQTAANKFVIPYYVTTLDVNHVYDASKDRLDPKRYQLPDQDFEVTIGNCAGKGAKVSAYDPLTNTSVPVQVTGSTATTLTVRLKTVDYPRILVIEEAKPGVLILNPKVTVDGQGLATVSWSSNLPAGAVKLSYGHDWPNRGANEITLPGGKSTYEVKIPTGIKDVVAVRVRVATNGLTTEWPRWDEEPAGQVVVPGAPHVAANAPQPPGPPALKPDDATALASPTGVQLPMTFTASSGYALHLPTGAALNATADESETDLGSAGKIVKLRARYVTGGAARMDDNLPFASAIDRVTRQTVKLPSGALGVEADYSLQESAHPGMTNLSQRFLLVPCGPNNADLLVLSVTGTPQAMQAQNNTVTAIFASLLLPKATP